MFHNRFPCSLLILGITVASPIMAQRAGRNGIGLKAGPQMSRVFVPELVSEPVPGALAGVYAPIWSANRFEIQPELLFSWQGSAFNVKDGGRAVFRSYHVQLPLIAKLYVSNALNFQCGVQASRLLKAQTSYEGEVDDVTEEYRPFETGVLLGLGADMLSGMDLSFQYYSGLSSLTDDTTLNPTYRSLRVAIGYRFWQLKSRHARRRM